MAKRIAIPSLTVHASHVGSEASAPTPAALPLDGLSRWGDLRPSIPLSRETVRQRELEGRFPRSIRLTQRCTVWKNREIHRYLADPLNYRAADAASEVTEGA
ncbi:MULTISPECIES: helix-turn-helix transcriptional regulator [Burkholderia]|uniref:helix-turn-helix transcriptional regulator n=1 Tax=Burkholderia TaxID=32008 RepID=UPI0009B1F7C7|nr:MULTISPECIES: AlpA family phage regulatory protein [Burkholderia]